MANSPQQTGVAAPVPTSENTTDAGIDDDNSIDATHDFDNAAATTLSFGPTNYSSFLVLDGKSSPTDAIAATGNSPRMRKCSTE